MQLCLPCALKVIEYRKQLMLYKKQLTEKPKTYNLCRVCFQLLGIEKYLYRHRSLIIEENRKERQKLNCITPCGYGMFSNKWWNENVIKKRRC